MGELSIINKQFIEAAKNNQFDKLKNLLSQGADIHSGDDCALRLSAHKGHLKIVKILIEHGANIHANDDEALRWSAMMSHVEAVKFLISQGADIHANDDKIFKTATKNGNEPMLMLLNAFLTEEKLLVAALGSMPVLPAVASVALVAAVGVTSASTWVGGMPVLPGVGSVALSSTGMPEKLINNINIKKIKTPPRKI